MVIKNKDGSVYKISGPNPLMDRQDFWNDFITHNLDWLSEVAKDDTARIFKEYKEEKIQEQLNIPTIKEENVKIEKKPEQTEKTEKNIKKYNPILCFCLPAKNIEKKDDLYDESYERTEYLDKFITEIVLLEKEDINIKIWCEKLLTKKTIIYPKNKDKRWWKISDIQNAPVGYYYIADISDYTPSFE